MALATRCPNCQAMFRVVSDQLKLRGGLVRCGSCRHVFDAIGSLSYIDDAALSAPAAPAAPSREPVATAPPGTSATTSLTAVEAVHELSDLPAASEEAPPTQHADVHTAPVDAAREPASVHRPSLPEAVAAHADSTASVESSAAVDPLAVPTLLAPSAMETTEPLDAIDGQSRGARRARTERARVVNEPAASTETADAGVAPDATELAPAAEEDVAFLRNPRRRRGFSIFFGGGSAALAVVLLLQLAVLFRTELITRWPQLRPTLVTLCDFYGCSVGWPTRAELLAVVGTELQAIPGTDILELTAVVRNRASFKVALPAVEITLTDTNNRTLARKVFAPVDYLASGGEPSSRINEGLGAGSDYIVRITFEARGLNAAGFVVYPFYL